MTEEVNAVERPIGAYFIKKEELSFEQAEEILRYQQEHPSMKFGEIAVRLGYIGYEAVNAYLDKLKQ